MEEPWWLQSSCATPVVTGTQGIELGAAISPCSNSGSCFSGGNVSGPGAGGAHAESSASATASARTIGSGPVIADGVPQIPVRSYARPVLRARSISASEAEINFSACSSVIPSERSMGRALALNSAPECASSSGESSSGTIRSA
jgi:hypothetical protein